MPITAQQFYQRWSDGMNRNTDKITRGVAAVTVAPAIAAVDQINKMRANWLAAIDSGLWTGRMSSVTLQQWQQAMTQKGIPRIADGVRGAQARVTNFAQQFLPFIAGLRDQVRQMPRTTPQDAEARVLAWMRGMRNFTYNRS